MSTPSRGVVAILLAAGSGSRFGGDKLLHPLDDGVALAAHAARNLLAVLPDVVAVVRWGDFPLYDLLEQEGCQVTMFKGAARGMGASLAHGISQSREAAGWVVALGDMPGISPETIKRIVDTIGSGALIAAPAYKGERGHPVGFGAALRDELVALDGDQGARAVLDRHREAVKLIGCEDAGIMLDVDRKTDLDGIRGPQQAA
jgi:molybdenum cofactor cytidylyltransferase